MEALEYKNGKAIVLELRGRVDEFNTRVLQDELDTILNTGRFFIAIDLANVSFLSAHCLKAIWKCQRRAESLGGNLFLSGAAGEVLETIHWVGFDSVVRRFQETTEACAALNEIARVPLGRLVPPSGGGEAEVDVALSSAGHSGGKERGQGRPADAASSTLERVHGAVKKWLGKWMVGVAVGFAVSNGLSSSSSGAFAQEPAAAPASSMSSMSSVSAVESTDRPSEARSAFTLDEVLALAREASPQIKLARLKMIEREAEVKIAKSYSFPKVMATSGYLYQSNPTVVSEIVNREINNVYNQSDEVYVEQPRTRTKVRLDENAVLLGVGFAQLVYAGGLYKNQIALKESQRNEAQAQVAIESLSIEEQVRNLFIGLLLVKEKINLLTARREATQSRLAAIQRAREARTVNAVQVAEIDIQALKAEQDLLDAAREERSLRGLLNIGLGRPGDAPLQPVRNEKAPNMELESAEHYYEIAVHRYPELRRSQALMDSAASYLKVVDAQSVFTPQVVVFGSTEYTQGLSSTGKDLSWSLGVGMVVPLFDGRKSNAEFEKAHSLASQARIAYDESERKLKIEITEVVSRIEQARLSRLLADKSLEIARNRRVEAESAVAQGQIPQYRLSEVQAQEIEARIAGVAADAELYKWHTRLLLLTGQREL